MDLMRFILRFVVLACIVLTFVPSTNGLIHKLNIKADSRKHFFIENFGFVEKGQLFMQITDWKVGGQPLSHTTPDSEKWKRLAFLIKVTETDSTAFLEENAESKCILDSLGDQDGDEDGTGTDNIIVHVRESALTELNKEISKEDEGFYNTYFINCQVSQYHSPCIWNNTMLMHGVEGVTCLLVYHNSPPFMVYSRQYTWL